MRLLPTIEFLFVVGYAFANIVEIIEEGSGEEEIITKKSYFGDELLPNLQQSVSREVTSAENITEISPVTIVAFSNSTEKGIEACLPKLDLIFLLDTSDGLEQTYQEHLRWAVSLVSSLKIEPDAVQVAAVQYAGFPLTEFALGTYPTREDIRAHLEQINRQSGVTRTGYALRKAEAELFREERGARKDALKVIILFTDRLSIDDPLKPAAQLREIKGVKIYVVSTITDTDGFKLEMSKIAGSNENVFGPNDLPRLRSVILSDTERARACSQIGPSWLKNNKVTYKPTGPPKILNVDIFPPLDFLSLVEDDVNDSDDILQKKNLVSVSYPTVDFDVDAKTPVLMAGSDTRLNSDSSVSKVAVNGDPNTAMVSNVESTMIPIEEVKIQVISHSSNAADFSLQNESNIMPTVEKTTRPKAIKNSDNKILKKAVKGEIPLARTFAAPSFSQTVSESDEQHSDVFDLNEDERKSFSLTTPSITTTSKSSRIIATRRPFTIKVTSTSAPLTSTARTNKHIFMTRSKPASTTPSTISSTTLTSTLIQRFTTTIARKALTRIAAYPITTQHSQTTSSLMTRLSTPTTPILSRLTAFHQRPTTRFPSRRAPNLSGKCPMDVLFIVDSSGSVEKIYEKQKEYLMDIFSKVQISDEHRVSLIQFAGSKVQKMEWSFDAFKESVKLMKALRQVRLITGTTYIGAALDSALEVLEKRRHNVPVIVVLISDGFSQDDPILAANHIRQIANMEFYSLSISELANTSLLTKLVGYEENVYVGLNADKLKNLLIKKLVCQ